MAYYYIAETNLSYLNKGGNKWLLNALRVLLLFATFYGTVKTAEAAWTLGDIGVGLMAWLIIIAIILLRKPALKVLKDYEKQRKAGKDPVFKAEDAGISHTDQWLVADQFSMTSCRESVPILFFNQPDNLDFSFLESGFLKLTVAKVTVSLRL